LKRSLKVYTFLLGKEEYKKSELKKRERKRKESGDEIGEISFWFMIKTKDFPTNAET
jgi:hypothetical protein